MATGMSFRASVPAGAPAARRALLLMVVCVLVAAAELGLAFGALAADVAKQAPANESQPMKMDEPMTGEMMKKGMKKGDVKKAAEEKEREMKAKLEKEEQSMPQAPAKK